ncbi:MAG: hypothetical protein JST32_14155 [Bacteroidetes bacterium]|nr:hypothetical protein [Bacteroidota bacterium]
MNKDEKGGTNARTRDAYESRCPGLTGGIAYSNDLKTPVYAGQTTKAAGPFHCRVCLSAAIVRKCSDKDDHFAHKARLSPDGRSASTVFHHQVRDELCRVLEHQYPDGCWRTEVEMQVPGSHQKLRADIAGYFGTRRPGVLAVAVEVQCSPYSPAYLRKKTADYAALGVHVLWVVPLTSALGDSEFRPRRYELYLHTLYLGYVFYYEYGKGGLLNPVHFGPAFRYIEPKTFFDEEANEVATGDYYLKYKTLKLPSYGHPVLISDLVGRSLDTWANPHNNKLHIPERKIMALKQGKWWPDDEMQEWLKDNDWFRYARTYLPDYEPDDEYDNYDSYYQ